MRGRLPHVVPPSGKHGGRRPRDIARVAGGFALGASCLWLSLRGASGPAVLLHIHSASFPLLALAMGLVVLVAIAKALRWQWLFPAPTPAPSFKVTFGILMTSQMINLLVPVRLGELARVGLMRQPGKGEERGVPAGTTIGTIVVEKTIDLVAIGVLVLLAAPLAVLPAEWRSEIGGGGLAVALGLLAALFAAGHFRRQLLRVLESVPAPHGRLGARLHRNALRLAGATLSSLGVLEGPHLARVLAITAGIWLLSAAMLVVMFAAFGLPPEPGMALVLMLALTSSNWAPTPPALIGLVGAVTIAVLTRFGIGQDASLALGTVLNVVLVAPPVLLGAWAVWSRLLAFQDGGWRSALGLSGDPAARLPAEEPAPLVTDASRTP